MSVYSWPDIYETRRCPHGNELDDDCEPCEKAEQEESEQEDRKWQKPPGCLDGGADCNGEG